MAPLCRHWARKGRCDYGDRCRFRHERVPSDDPPSTSGGVEEGDATADKIRDELKAAGVIADKARPVPRKAIEKRAASKGADDEKRPPKRGRAE